MLCRYIGIYSFSNTFFILTLRLGIATSASWVNIINLFFKFFTSSCALKWNATSPLGSVYVGLMLIFSEEISLLIVIEFLGLELFVVILSILRIRPAACCKPEALQLTEFLVLSFVIGSWISDKAFAVSKAFPGDWREILTVSSFLARSCVPTETSILVILFVEVWVDEVSCSIKFLCVIPANLAVFKLHLRHL